MSTRRHLHLVAAAIALVICTGALPAVAIGDDASLSAVPDVPDITTPVPWALIPGTMVVTGHVDASTTVVRVTTPGRTVTAAVSPGPSGAAYSVSVPLRYGKSLIGVAAGNDAGFSRTRHRIVYNLGTTPGGSHFVLVDKSDLTLYRVRDGRVKAYPVAIGMPGTPTPVGSWHLGRIQRMGHGGPYGVLRMPLMRKVRVKVRITVRVRGGHVHKSVWRTVSRGNGYYVHGTNAPWSIGTMASHGCVRMFNSNVTALSKVIPGWPITIRR